MLTYRKTKNDQWVVFGPASDVHVGVVTVTRRDGAAKTETVERIGKPFDMNGVPHVYGYIAPRADEQRTAMPSRRGLRGCPRCRRIPGEREAQIWEECSSCGAEPIYV